MRQKKGYLLALLMILLGSSCSDKIEPGSTKTPPPLVRGVSVSTARIVEMPIIYEAVGTVTAGISSTLSSKLMGVIEDMRVREGSRVGKGETLAVIDPRQVQAQEQKAEAAMAEAKKALSAAVSARDAAQSAKELAYATYERYLQLKDAKMISKQAFDEVEAGHRQAEAELRKADAGVDEAKERVRQAESALSEARVARKDALITAPHDGIITAKLVDKGDLASPGKPLLTLETTRGFCVDSIVPETYVNYVAPMQKVNVKVPALMADSMVGTVCTIVPSADPKSRSFIVKINLPVDFTVRSGMFARVEIPAGSSRKLLIERKAVFTRGQLIGIYLVDPQNIARLHLIRLGKAFGDTVEVISGLKEGDRYVTAPLLKIKDGVRVEEAP